MLQWISENFKGKSKRTTVRRIILVSVVFLFSFFLIGYSNAQGVGAEIASNTEAVGSRLGLPSDDIRVIIARVIRVALGLLGIVLVVINLYGGFLWMTAGGNESQISTAKKVLYNGVIGLIIIMSSYAIVSFVLSKLTNGAEGGLFGGNGPTLASYQQNFYGSGGLGTVITDHYPMRDQKDVPRNAKILITFRPAVRPSSFINNTNGTVDSNSQPLLGDCIKMGDADFNWDLHCDQLIMGSETISITNADSGEQLPGAAALISYENGKAYTVVIRPSVYLGNDESEMGYKVRVGKNIQVDDSTNNYPSIFEGRAAGRDFYEWSFYTGTQLDTTPPHVTSVYPSSESVEGRNSVIQINFNKAMDPTGLQGEFSAVNDYFTLSGNNIYLKSKSGLPTGTFKIVNNYRTLEFTPTTQCGENACGGTVYCLPVTGEVDGYEVLLRTAQTFSSASFESIPFSGAMDIAGNALDGNHDYRVDQVDRTASVFPDQFKPDNYGWKFYLESKLDLTAPYIKKTTPGPDATYITSSEELSLLFSKRMRSLSLYNIEIDERPVSGEPLCKSPSADYLENNDTYVQINHCPFLSSDETPHYYYPIVDSRVEDVNFNCFYPGMGPDGLEVNSKSSQVCDPSVDDTCCSNIGMNEDTNAFCCNGDAGLVNNKNDCINALTP